MNKLFFGVITLLSAITAYVQSDVKEIPPYDWGRNVINAPKQTSEPGYQVLHFGSTNWPYQDSPEGIDFVERYLHNAKPLTSDADLIRYASDHVSLKGAYIELGVTTGKTINFIAALNSQKNIYGFDSFLGNPEDYEKDGHKYSKGTFGLKDPTETPPVLNNVKLIQGTFDETLPYFVKKYLHGEPIAFLHVDCDIYSSTSTALQILGPYIVPGTIILFDDFYGYADYEKFEFKALMEFLDQYGYDAEYIAYNTFFEGVAVRIKNRKEI